MPEPSGKRRLSKGIRLYEQDIRLRRALKNTTALTRKKALKRLAHALIRKNAITDDVLQLMALFQFQGDDLTEAGVSYEMVMALEKRYPMLLGQAPHA